MFSTILDISRTLGEGTPAYPGDTPLSISWTTPHGQAAAAISALTLSPHLGTHVDAPLHLNASGADAAGLRLQTFVGPCWVIGVPAGVSEIDRESVPILDDPPAARILLRTASWPTGSRLPETHPAPTPGLIDHLADRGVVLVGVDTPSVDPPNRPDLPAHHRCLARAMAILEGLDLSTAAPGPATLVAAPLKLVGIEASPVRAFLIPATSRFSL